MRYPLSLAITLMITVFAGCESTPETSDKDVVPISYKELQTMIDEASEKKPLVIIDVRTLVKYEAGHLPGAINIFLRDFRLITAEDPRLADASKIIVYGDGFDDTFSPIAAKDLLARGYDDVFDFRGGWSKWKKEQAVGQPDGKIDDRKSN